MISPTIHESWKQVLRDEFQKPYFANIKNFLVQEKQAGKVIYPKGKDIFRAFDETPFDQVNVVILGQDPYHGPGQAHGLCFSVPAGIPKPPSLVNIFKEMHDDVGGNIPESGDLTYLAHQGVFLLNAILTVEAGKPTSHQHIGWQTFTDAVIQTISAKKTGVVFLLRGSFAQSKIALIDTTKHHVLTAPHPSPLSAHRGFFGCRHFSKTNEFLRFQGKREITWLP